LNNSATAPLVAIVLAAGRGTRFGADKLAAELSDGRALGVASAMPLREVVDRVVVVVNALHSACAARFRDAGFELVAAPNAELGMGHSLAYGISVTATAAAWLVCLADMPGIDPGTLTSVTDALRGGASIVVPRYHQRSGHPVGFNQRHAAALMALTGDRGARDLIQGCHDEVCYIEVEDAGICRDVDRPADLAAL